MPWNTEHTHLSSSPWTTSGSIFLLKPAESNTSHTFLTTLTYQTAKGAWDLNFVKETGEICTVYVCVYVLAYVCLWFFLEAEEKKYEINNCRRQAISLGYFECTNYQTQVCSLHVTQCPFLFNHLSPAFMLLLVKNRDSNWAPRHLQAMWKCFDYSFNRRLR